MRASTKAVPLRLALIGLENLHAGGWLNTLATFEDVRLVAAYRNRPGASLPLLGQLFGEVPIYDDLAALLGGVEFEAALVLLNGRDAPAAMMALAQAGKHMLAEKPAARAPAELAPVAEVVRQKGLVFYPGFATRAKRLVQDMRQAVGEGLLGQLLHVQATFLASLVERRGPDHELFQHQAFGGGILPWLGIHYLDLMRYVSCAEPSQVSALVGNVSGQPIDVEDVATLSLRFDNGMLGSFNCGYVLSQEPKHLLFAVYGSRGWLRWQGGDQLELWSEDEAHFTAPGRTSGYLAPAAPGYGGREGQYFLRSFRRAIAGEEAPLLGVDDLLRALCVIEAAYLSAASGKSVAL